MFAILLASFATAFADIRVHPNIVSHHFDPLLELLEVGQTELGRTTWKLKGPDMDGRLRGSTT